MSQPAPDTQPVTAARWAMEHVRVQDLFSNETANLAHVFSQRIALMDQNGNFTNAKCGISHLSEVMTPNTKYANWDVAQLLSDAREDPMTYSHPSQITDKLAQLRLNVAGGSFDCSDALGSIRWPCKKGAPTKTTLAMHIDALVHGQVTFMLTADMATRGTATQRFALLPTIGRIISQWSVDALTLRTPNLARHDENRLEIQSREAEERGIADRDWVGIESVAGDTTLRAVMTNPVHPAFPTTSYIHRRPAQTSSRLTLQNVRPIAPSTR